MAYMHVQGRQHPPSDTFCSPLTVLCHGNFQAEVIRVSSELTSMTLCESEKRGTESGLKCFYVVTRSLSQQPPNLPNGWQAGFLHLILLNGTDLSSTLSETDIVNLKAISSRANSKAVHQMNFN